MPQDRTFVVTAPADISADGMKIVGGTRVAMITSPVSVQTLLGMIQYHNATVEEITTEVSEDTIDVDGDVPPVVDAEQVSQPTTEPASTEEVSQEETQESTSAVAQFMADGVDEKTAKVLADDNGLDPDKLRELLAEGLDLVDLEGIGQTRAEKLLAIYKAK